nr:MAG TPA: hypothetical protein [Caudoviricetes sp.]
MLCVYSNTRPKTCQVFFALFIKIFWHLLYLRVRVRARAYSAIHVMLVRPLMLNMQGKHNFR